MRFFLRRLVFYVITFWAAVTINFLIPRIMPGDPVSALIAKNQGRISTDATEALRTLFGLDQNVSLWQQYVDYWACCCAANSASPSRTSPPRSPRSSSRPCPGRSGSWASRRS